MLPRWSTKAPAPTPRQAFFFTPPPKPARKGSKLCLSIMACSITLGLIFYIVFGLIGRSHTLMIPGPDDGHSHKVATAHFALTDSSRGDPYLANTTRSVMTSIFLPVPKNDCANECASQYMPLVQTSRIADQQFLTNTNGQEVFWNMQYNVCCGSSATIDAASLPVVVLEAHTDTSRLLYSNLARFVAANGVVVILIDHPGETSIVEGLPDQPTRYNSGATPLSNFSPINPWNETVSRAIDVRIQDVKFVLSQLSNIDLLEHNFHFLRFSSALNTETYGVIGHGLGGSVASKLAFEDAKVLFHINMGGTPPLLTSPSPSTTYFLGRTTYSRTDDIHWSRTWAQLTGRATEFDLVDSDVFDFSDLPIILETARGEGRFSGVEARGLGRVGPWGNHAVVCLVEAAVKREMLGDLGAVRGCVVNEELQKRIKPYLG